MSQEAILITDHDSRRLRRLVETGKARNRRDVASIEWLERRLDEAEVTPAARIGPDVVTMNSHVRVTDLDRGETFEFQVVFPPGAGLEGGRVSVVAPLGMAVLGSRVGEEITWEVPGGVRRLRVEEVLYQPEREGKDVA